MSLDDTYFYYFSPKLSPREFGFPLRSLVCLIEMDDGRWCAFEIKLGANQIDAAAKNLLDINQKIKDENGKPASVLCVICGMSNAAYKRPDGVYVVPITALKN